MLRDTLTGRARLRGIFAVGAGGVMLALTAAAQAQDDAVRQLPDIEVIGTTPVLGSGVPVEQVPSNVQIIDREALEATDANTLADFLDQAIGSAAVIDGQNNPYQRNLQYRGYTAAPLLGEPQGLAIYQNGVRINEPFGDVVQWDLIPEVALREVQLVNTNPAFGLNTLGGAVAMRMHDGNSFQGYSVEGSFGSFGRLGTQLQAGGRMDDMSAYVAAEYLKDDGWRDQSPSDLQRLYADIGVDREAAGIHFTAALANTDLIGNGPAPVELLAIDREAVFTTPDITDNELFLGSLQAYMDVSPTVSIQANAYVRNLTRNTVNGDETEAGPCFDDDDDDGTGGLADAFEDAFLDRFPVDDPDDFEGYLCAEELEENAEGEYVAELVLDENGMPVEADDDIAYYGALNTSTTETEGVGVGIQTVIDRPIGGLGNRLTIGASLDRGRTDYHSVSTIGELHESDRSVTADDDAAENTAVLEFEGDADGVEPEDEAERGEIGPASVTAENTYLGIFFSDTISVTDNLSVTLAGRYNRAEIDLDDTLDERLNEVYFERETEDGRSLSLDGSHSYSRFNPAVGATYTLPQARTTLFASYAESNRAPSPAELTCAEPEAPCRLPNAFLADPDLKQVVSRTFEAGARGNSPGGRLDWTISAYRSENEDDILFISTPETALGSGFFSNVGKTQRQGLEIGVGGSIWEGVSWFANYSLIDATFEEEFDVPSANHPTLAESDDDGDDNGDETDSGGRITVEPGDTIPGIPRHNLNVGLDIELLDGLKIGPRLTARSGVYLRGDEANLLDTTDSYTVVNLNASYRFMDSVEIFGRIENLFDTEYETFGLLGERAEIEDGEVEIEVPITELPGGVTDPRFLSPGQPFAAYIGVRITL